MILRTFLLSLIFLISGNIAFSQTQKDTIFVVKTTAPVVVDGSGADAVWSKTNWHPINQVWIPYAAQMANGDFEGKFKVAWDTDYLYVLVEVVDNMISDDYANPLQNWWDDDCLEVFIDEDRSKGPHERNNNAFAYHVSTKYDAIDLDANGNGINYKNNLNVIMDTIGTHTYLWEMAIKIYNSKFSVSNPEASRVKLSAQKLMGFTIAYCDNDETKSRENFIGSMFMTAATANDNYKTADYFGSMLLSNREEITSAPTNKNVPEIARIYPIPAKNELHIQINTLSAEKAQFEISSISGTLLKSGELKTLNQIVQINDLTQGIYFLRVSSGGNHQTIRFVKTAGN
jgi:hypothetical protein